MPHICAACKCEIEPQSDDRQSSLPQGWFKRTIDETDYILCDVCGASIHFRGAISPYLTDCLQLADGAQCDMSSEALGLARKRRERRKG